MQHRRLPGHALRTRPPSILSANATLWHCDFINWQRRRPCSRAAICVPPDAHAAARLQRNPGNGSATIQDRTRVFSVQNCKITVGSDFSPVETFNSIWSALETVTPGQWSCSQTSTGDLPPGVGWSGRRGGPRTKTLYFAEYEKYGPRGGNFPAG
ncbi:hypothetical protein Salat_1038500 [Sesamum alatum]|uniref:Pectinesterase n=1 Tax=Sesamum alatum TaxID=300844 RepID=A0AAE1YN96_9LAMI|nr:hypothetical protein Salat_1038500 [Sesamum alatum]